MADLLVRGGTIVTADRIFHGDVLVRDGRIWAVIERVADHQDAGAGDDGSGGDGAAEGGLSGRGEPGPRGDRFDERRASSGSAEPRPGADGLRRQLDGADVIDATGLYVLPGLVDVHVHFREPGLTHKEDFLSGTAAAACGGVTTVLDMPNTKPPVATAAALLAKAQQVAGRAYVDYGLYGAVTEDNLAELPAMAEAGAVAFKLFLGPTTGDIRAPGWGRLMEVFAAVRETGLPLAVHAEDRDVIEYWQARRAAEATDYRGFLETRPPFGELAATQNVALLAQRAGTPVHIAHVTLAEAVDLIREAKERGAPITAETCPPYLLLTADDCQRLGPVSKVLPPIRERLDQEMLWQGLHEGVLDCIATDHAPHLDEEKQGKAWLQAPGGMIGVETLLPSLLTQVRRGRLTLQQLVAWTSRRPAEIFGLGRRKGDIRPGFDADLAIVDLDAAWTVRAEDLHSKGKNSPFIGASLQGKVVHTIVRGHVVVRNGQLTGPPRGGWLQGQPR
ncbi:MAG TPA: allantoinase AllB [Limnochordales bacterium]|nr:MAG: allantoinase AllB [Bacillota bacterium]HLT58998.1 allantoinase AllB [Limnochordales bacterium]